MKKQLALSFALLFFLCLVAPEKLDYFLPADVTYNPEIPTPEY